ncbi:ATP-dependent nuclease [Microvirga thermotolerans]|uniref:AAA family ATPase n=1 Tax=Microvirga thermotolerans TaxID=2651334 RepID=A0A5P9JXR7_9HYPH|nr:ATP-binding protein [Microvirga thermotolerans]QFU14754.1 AAA family ATPase [Microvirga thermotolerans]
MARVRVVEIRNFRSIKELSWVPSAGINCLVGPGDSGKSTILDALDLCLGARRNATFTDADFHNLNVDEPITILVTVGELEDTQKNFESYGLYLRGFNKDTSEVEDEPAAGLETVLTIKLEVQSDLEPSWCLVSDRATAQGQSRLLPWADRVKLAPTRIGAVAHHNLGWQRGSVLNRVSTERADASSALAKAARDARAAFGQEAETQLGSTLGIVANTARELGIPVGPSVKAMLDAHSVSFVGGTISLHDDGGVPLRGLGIGSTRLLIAGLQRKAAERSTIILVDELEHGLEPHRIIRFVNSLGSKEREPPLQVFATSHSPVALSELSVDQLNVVRRSAVRHQILRSSAEDDIQGTVRSYPGAFLATSIYVCEGASEVGLLRGLDQHLVAARGQTSLFASGAFLVDIGGAQKIYRGAEAFRKLGYRVAVLRDDDIQPTPEAEQAFTAAGGQLFVWRGGRTTEDELFLSLSDAGVRKLVALAVDLHGDDTVDSHIRSADRRFALASVAGVISTDLRITLGKAAKGKKSAWFKSVTDMETVGREIVAPDLPQADATFVQTIASLIGWASHG